MAAIEYDGSGSRVSSLHIFLLFAVLLYDRACVVDCDVRHIFKSPSKTSNTSRRSLFDPECSLSNEATKVKLMDFFKEVKKAYYEVNRYMAPTNYEYNDKQIKQIFQPYIPLPENLKANADSVRALVKQLDKLESKFDDLNPRELRMVFQFRYFLQSNLDNIYEGYYDGIWMLGPDYFCEQPICLVHRYFSAALRTISVKNLKDLELVIFWIKEHRKTFEQYLKNIKLGVETGMVYPIEVCKSASKTFALAYSKVHYGGEKGALKMGFAKLLLSEPFYNHVAKSSFKAYHRKHGETYYKSISNAIVGDFGRPLKALIDYLMKEHRQYCPSSNTSSGLGMLPLNHQYKDGEKQESLKTTKKLPSGETIDVTAGYRNLMEYYTASNVTGQTAMDLGYKLVDEFYRKVLELGHNITKEQDKTKMISAFLKILNGATQFCNEKEFPANESDSDAFDRCDNDAAAERACPERWKAKEIWFKNIRDVMGAAEATIGDFFHTEGPMKSTPECGIEIIPEYNPSNGVPSYLESDEMCSQPASYFVPYFKAKMGPKYEDFSTNFHEARPGHHLQIQGYLENFEDSCGGISQWITDVNDYYPSFSEGWAVYAENPILMEDTDILKTDNLKDKLSLYGVLKWQIWRALRLIVDVGFHANNMTREEALGLFKKYTWDDTDTTVKELTRYQGAPGQATSYIIGQQTILKYKNRSREELGDKFKIRDFHYHILSQGQSPFGFISIYVDKYIACTLDKSSNKFCDQILSGNNKKSNRRDILKPSLKEQRIKELFQLFKRRKHL